MDKRIKTRFGVSLLFPSAYKLVKDTFNFIWFQKEIQKGHLNFIVYQISSSEFKGDIKHRIIQIRDSIGEIYLPGRLENTNMITEKAYRPYFYKHECDYWKYNNLRYRSHKKITWLPYYS